MRGVDMLLILLALYGQGIVHITASPPDAKAFTWVEDTLSFQLFILCAQIQVWVQMIIHIARVSVSYLQIWSQ